MGISKKRIICVIICSVILIISCTKSKLVSNSKKIKIVSNTNKQNYIVDLGNGWFEITELSLIENITPEEAKEKAIQKALKKAIEYFSGIEISGRVIDLQAENKDEILLENFSSITQQTAQGIILEKEIISEKTISKGNTLQKVVTLKVKVGKQKGVKDPSFAIIANLNRDYFKDGEEMGLFVKSSKDCYLTILNVCSNDSVYVIFPNKYRNNNFLKSGDNFILPNTKDKDIGLYFPVNILLNKNKDVEIIKVIATKKKIDFSSIYSFSAYGTYQSTMIDLQNWLLKIPRNEIEEVDLQYFITK